MRCKDICSFVHKKRQGGFPGFSKTGGNFTEAIASTCSNRTKKMRILAEAGNTKVEYRGCISSTNPYISSINCNQDFSIKNYTDVTNCSSTIPCTKL